MEYRVIGPCTVAGVRPGGTVSHEVLEAQGANIPALLYYHLEAVKEAPKTRAPKRADA